MAPYKLVAYLAPRWRLRDDGLQWILEQGLGANLGSEVVWRPRSYIATRSWVILSREVRRWGQVGERLLLTEAVLRLEQAASGQ